MRVIAGKAKSLRLKTIESLDTRPTTDRIKETLFNMINPSLADCDFLDLFSGSGAIGIEALSRGAKSAVFVENNRAALDCIQSNLQFTRLKDNAQVLVMDAVSSIAYLEKSGKTFDIIFMDPPYHNAFEKEILNVLQHSDILHEDTIIIVEASIETDFDYVNQMNFNIYKEKKYKTNKHVFLEMK
jgi:16S rRNA (guanine(966)-N(2))-methyltransferase RsmD